LTVDFAWTNAKLSVCTVVADTDRTVTVKVPGATLTVSLKAGEAWRHPLR